MDRKVCLLFPYFGSFPNYFNLWVLSASKNSWIDFYIISDKCDYVLPDNIHFIKMSLGEIKERASHVLGFESRLSKPYKLCDYRPLYGLIFCDIIKDYNWWGYGDLDVIYGDLNAFIRKYLDNKNNKLLYGRGHLTILRNEKQINNMVLNGSTPINSIYQDDKFYSFDESKQGLAHIVSEKYGYCGDFNDVAEIAPEYSRLYNSGRKNERCRRIFCWDNGKLYDYYILGKKIITKEIVYIHLQKRRMKNKVGSGGSFIICSPNIFINYDNGFDLNHKFIMYHSRKSIMFELHFQYLYFKYYFLDRLEKIMGKHNEKII